MHHAAVHVNRMFSVLLLLTFFLVSIAGCGGPAALESSEAFASADALYTALTARRTDLLQNVTTRLRALNEEGKLSEDALQELTEIIDIARAERWQEAAEILDAFIRNQPEHSHSH